MALNFLKKLGAALFGGSGDKSKSGDAGKSGRQGQDTRHNGPVHPARKVTHPNGSNGGDQRRQQQKQPHSDTGRQQQQQRPQRQPKADRPQRPQQPRDPQQDARHDASIAAEAAEKAARTPSRTVTASSEDRPRREGRRGDRRDGSRRSDRSGRGPRRPLHDLPPTAEEAKSREARPAADPNWTVDKFVVEPVEGKKRFHDFDLPVEIMHAIADLNFQYCTPIQAESLALALEGRNVAGRAQTGTGKTAAFLVAILTRYLRSPESRPDKQGAPRALVIAPTRELVIQICRDAEALGRYCNLRCIAVYGGMDYNRQLRDLQEGPVDLLVATPGRLIDYQRQHAVDLSHVDTLVIDEADRMLDMGFIPDVRKIIRCLPPRDQRRTMLYSATLTDDVMNLASQWMPDPVKVEIDADPTTAQTIEQHVYITTTEEKFILLCNMLKRFEGQRVLIFCNRRVSTDRLAEEIDRRGFVCEVLSGDVEQHRRLRVIEAFRSGEIKIVVATDVAGRGLHIADIGLVVNYELPYEAEDYVHRIGRTGRAGHVGTAVSFADPDESFMIPDIEKYIGEELKCDMPEEELLAPLPPPPPRHHRRPRTDDAPAAASEKPGPVPESAAASEPEKTGPVPVSDGEKTGSVPTTDGGTDSVRPQDSGSVPASSAAISEPVNENQSEKTGSVPVDEASVAKPDEPEKTGPVPEPAAAFEPEKAGPVPVADGGSARPQDSGSVPVSNTAANADSAPRRQRHGNRSPFPRSAIEKFGPRPVIPGPQPAPQEWTPGQ